MVNFIADDSQKEKSEKKSVRQSQEEPKQPVKNINFMQDSVR